jgi:multiple sugar transport system ATP-binding protein
MTMGDRVAVLKDGVLQQVGAPLEVYERPSNLFVAGFIGSPAMSLLPGTCRDGQVRVGDYEIPLDRSAQARAGASVTVGVRPEAWRLASDGEPGGLRVEATVVEDIGADAYIYGSTVVDGRTEQIVVRSHGRPRPTKGESFRVVTEPKQLHLFDTESGERLSN